MITSLSNQRMKHVVQLTSKASLRKREGVFIVEGIKMFLEAPVEDIQEIYVSEGLLERKGEDGCGDLYDRLEELGYETVSTSVFEKMSDTRAPQGVLCVMKQPSYTMDMVLHRQERPLLLLLENLQDPGNLGTIIRTGEGAGVSAVIMSRDTVDIFNPKTIRSTMGSVYRVPFLYVEDFREAIGQVRAAGIHIFAAHLQGQTSYDGEDYREGTAFLIGNEGNGLTEETARLADHYIRIPMAGQVESLNAGIASALLMYEAARQRGWQK